MKTLRSVLLIVVLVVLSTLIVITVTPTTRDYSTSNNYWNGLSKFVRLLELKGVEVVVLDESIAPLSSEYRAGKAMLLVISPDVEFSDDDIRCIQDFLERGGVLLVLDDFHEGNSLLKGLNIPLKFYRAPLFDRVFYSKRECFPLIIIEDLNMTLLMNYPTALSVERGGEWNIDIIAYSSEYSFLDIDLDSRLSTNDTQGPLPVAVVLKREHGEGVVVICSDPSILINCMIEKYDNFRFIEHLIRSYEVSIVVVDDYHRRRTLLESIRSEVEEYVEILTLVLRDPLCRFVIVIVATVLLLVSIHSLLSKYYED